MKPIIDAQMASFREQGYAVLPGLISQDQLEKLKASLEALIFEREDDTGVTAYEIDGKLYVHSLEKVCSRGDLACLELLGSPAILGVAEALCGPDFFMIQEFAVIKMLGDTSPVLWHQDMANERTGTCFTMGVYLDDAAPGDGALRVVPGSHNNGKTICEAQHDPSIEVPMRAGDILIHDMMLAHSSGIMTKNSIRKVLYFEFVTASQVLGERIYTEALVERRTRLIPLAIQHHQTRNPGTAPFAWKNPRGYFIDNELDIANELDMIYKDEIHARPSAYCFEFNF